MEIRDLRKKAYGLRLDTLQMLYESPIPAGHIGGCFSAAEILTALYYEIMKEDSRNAEMEDRDRFIMSKGHNCAILYALLADRGYFDKELLHTYRGEGSILQGHPDATKCPGIEVTTGSLGQGLSMSLGMALAAKYRKQGHHIYTLISDGELQAGITLEAAMAAGHYQCSNLTCLVDRNHLQVCGNSDSIMSVEPLEDRWIGFGWDAIRIDGHHMESLLDVLTLSKQRHEKPMVVICDTIKGKGVSFMENIMQWHSAAITADIYHSAKEELQRRCDDI